MKNVSPAALSRFVDKFHYIDQSSAALSSRIWQAIFLHFQFAKQRRRSTVNEDDDRKAVIIFS